MPDEIDPIPAQEARQILMNAIRERLGDDWQDEQDGWVMLTGHDYMARVTRGRVTLDFYVDLLGNVTVEQAETSYFAQSGRLLTWMLLGLSLVIAILIVRIASGS